jgi:hypothetical protein
MVEFSASISAIGQCFLAGACLPGYSLFSSDRAVRRILATAIKVLIARNGIGYGITQR